MSYPAPPSGIVYCETCVMHGKFTPLKLPTNPYQKVLCPVCGSRFHLPRPGEEKRIIEQNRRR